MDLFLDVAHGSSSSSRSDHASSSRSRHHHVAISRGSSWRWISRYDHVSSYRSRHDHVSCIDLDHVSSYIS